MKRVTLVLSLTLAAIQWVSGGDAPDPETPRNEAEDHVSGRSHEFTDALNEGLEAINALMDEFQRWSSAISAQTHSGLAKNGPSKSLSGPSASFNGQARGGTTLAGENGPAMYSEAAPSEPAPKRSLATLIRMRDEACRRRDETCRKYNLVKQMLKEAEKTFTAEAIQTAAEERIRDAQAKKTVEAALAQMDERRRESEWRKAQRDADEKRREIERAQEQTLGSSSKHDTTGGTCRCELCLPQRDRQSACSSDAKVKDKRRRHRKL